MPISDIEQHKSPGVEGQRWGVDPFCEDTRVEVCDNCLKASCWHYLFMCDDSDIAGTTFISVRDLRTLDRENESYWWPRTWGSSHA